MTYQYLSLSILGVIFFAAMISLFFDRLVMKNLHRLSDVFKHRFSGEDELPIIERLGQKDEIEGLVDGLEELAVCLANARNQLQGHAQNLERRVEDRTQALDLKARRHLGDARLFVTLLSDFGHVKGAFTGAERNRDGFFLAADKGTLILDEIGDISLSTQAKLLKFLQDKEVKPVGSSVSKVTDVRILALTNQNLEQRIRDGRFREDLYYRLNVLLVTVPPLRERSEDIPVLVRTFLDRTCREMQLKPMEIHPAALKGHPSRRSSGAWTWTWMNSEGKVNICSSIGCKNDEPGHDPCPSCSLHRPLAPLLCMPLLRPRPG